MPDILVIDDDAESLQVMQRQLDALGSACDTVSGALRGLSLWEKGDYRLVIAECSFGEMDGPTLAGQIRTLESSRDVACGVPVIAWTKDVMTDTIGHCFAAGMNGYLPKPLQADALRAVIEIWPTPQSATEIALPHEHDGKPSTAAVLSEQSLKAFSGGDRSAEKEIFLHLLEISAKDRFLLHSAIDERNAERTRLISHRIKGAYLLLGAAPLCAILQKMELAATSQDWQAILEAVAPMEREYQKLGLFMKRWMEREQA